MRLSRRHNRQLRHRIFFALGFTIFVAVAVAGLVLHTAFGRTSPEVVGMKAFASERFAAVWDDPAERADWVNSIYRHFKVRVTLRDAQGAVLVQPASDCKGSKSRLDVVRNGQRLGVVEACYTGGKWPKSAIIALVTLVLLLWLMSGFIARNLVRPLDELVKVVGEIGNGNLEARMQLCRHGHGGEVGMVARAVNQMAEKIERQLATQRELLAAVSHEIRSPLARMRVLVELERENHGDSERLGTLDAELSEMDSLVGKLLAQSKLEFQSLELRNVTAADVARTTLQRAGVPTELLIDQSGAAQVRIDVSLFGRALANVVENAQRHGQGLTELRIARDNDKVRFEFRDRGPGFAKELIDQALQPFVGTPGHDGLGLGLALVERIVRAHHGKVTLANTAEGGAVVSVEVARGEEA